MQLSQTEQKTIIGASCFGLGLMIAVAAHCIDNPDHNAVMVMFTALVLSSVLSILLGYGMFAGAK